VGSDIWQNNATGQELLALAEKKGLRGGVRQRKLADPILIQGATAMNELSFTLGTVLFLMGWLGVIFIVRGALASLENFRLVWCPEMFTFSWVETAVRNLRADPELRTCSLWPEQQGCKQRCVR